ncbi:MAG: hypothetical protein ABI766_04740, partial [Gemmatimonadales bacterium]
MALIAARLDAAPALYDPTGGTLSPFLHLHAPWLYVLLAPLFTLWDGVSMLSMSRLIWFLIGLAVFYALWRIGHAIRCAWWHQEWSWRREVAILAASFAALVAFVALGLLWHRPMISLVGAGPGYIVTDFHSHTNVSHDVRGTLMRGFDGGANLRWHKRAGFDAVFITDHNTVEGLGHPAGRPARCAGIEVSAWRAHVVLLGDSIPVDRTRYNGSLEALETLLAVSDSAYGALSVLSLPEYEQNHWSRLDSLMAAGADGIEIVNAAPKAAEMSRARRDSVVALAGLRNRFVVGVSDSHGWGATSLVWNLVHSPGWRSTGDPCPRILAQLHTGFAAVQVVERHHLETGSWWPRWLTP